MEQLIVGVLLFTPLLGLFPTTVAWYISACCYYGLLLLTRQLLAGLAALLQLRSLSVLGRRWAHPQLFPGALLVRPLLAARAQQQQQQHSTVVQVQFCVVQYAPLSFRQVVLQSINTAGAIGASQAVAGCWQFIQAVACGRALGLRPFSSCIWMTRAWVHN